MTRALALAVGIAAALAATAAAQSITLPPDGDNQRSEVTQQIGRVSVSIAYGSPDVHAPNGDDRRGKIFGTLVPYGIHDLGFNNRKGPWRAGANQNTVFTVSHPVTIQGQPLPAGRYGLHMIAGPTEWTLIFSKNSTSWGSFSYDQAEDQLRVTVTPEKAPYREWLSYEFLERQPDRAVSALEWEDLRVPLHDRRAADGHAVCREPAPRAARLRRLPVAELERRGAVLPSAEHQPGGGPDLGRQRHRPAVRRPGELHHLLDQGADSRQAGADRRGDHGDDRRRWTLPNALPVEIHQYGRQLQQQGKQAEAMAVYQKNAKRFGDAWPVHVGLARGYSAAGDYKTALTHAERALAASARRAQQDLARDGDRRAQARQGHERPGAVTRPRRVRQRERR